ncbi:MAG: FAD-binding oxidoreductase [Flavobacteriales bacterium]|mgnify:CR=1 FL=1|nr:FAD-binding oxidoreductase [Flavobacteriales bacterium]MBK6944389.1 FAD-binding oxidoreductase [Flavobacteriales bacterium]MBK7242066.1 FAD-binding oxidoreductase [Flavobacteriales bacterium]MBK7298042.1 FAD-binding oxidoreductase [Flavobacteriales bacterium]MBK9534057.1 FAD-binding oxidoreductase [Flavobacteriales bacterium]
MQNDVIILGHGLAGAVLAEVLQQRGSRIHVFDQRRNGNASLVAAGVVNPIVFKRDIPSWRAGELLPIADTFYRSWQECNGVDLWHPLPMVKVFPTPIERDQWERVMQDTESSPFIAQRPEIDVDQAPVDAPHGYGTVTQAAWLDVPATLSAQRETLIGEGRFTERDVREEEVLIGPDHISIGDVRAHWLVRCTGPFSTAQGLAPVKGETLLVRIPGLEFKNMVHRRVFILPLGDDVYRIGSTFDWTNVWTGRTVEAREELLGMLRAFVKLPIEVLEHSSGVRPATKDRRPILGRTGRYEAIFNGLGSRGVLLAPWCAMHLAEHLFEGKEIDPEVSFDRFS